MPVAPAPKPFVIPVFIPHAGCPHRCVFCDQTRTTGRTDSLPAPDQVHKTIEQYLGYRKNPDRMTEISFYGGNFLGLSDHDIVGLLDLAQHYVARGVVQGIRFSTRPDTVDRDRLRILDRYRVSTIELGVQSLNDEVLKISRRGHTAQHTLEAVALLKSRPYRLGLQMMVGLPGDTFERAMATAERIALAAPDFVRIYPTLVLPDSPLARWYAKGFYAPLTLDAAVDQVKSLYRLFSSKGIRVVRMGLQPTEELNADAGVVAGPIHPAFGELVHSALWLDAVREVIARERPGDGNLEIRLNPKLFSRVKGHRSTNPAALAAEFDLQGIVFREDEQLPLNAIWIDGRRCHI